MADEPGVAVVDGVVGPVGTGYEVGGGLLLGGSDGGDVVLLCDGVGGALGGGSTLELVDGCTDEDDDCDGTVVDGTEEPGSTGSTGAAPGSTASASATTPTVARPEPATAIVRRRARTF